MSGFLLDTNVVSSLIRERGASPAFERASDNQAHVFTSILVAAEIRFGIAKKRSTRLQREADGVLRDLIVLPFETPADIVYAQVRADLDRRGLTIGGNDLLIAAQCLALGLTLVTHNTREFARVKGLPIEDWLTT